MKQKLKVPDEGIPDEVLADIEKLEEDARVNEVRAHVDPSGNNNEDDDGWLDQMVGDFLIENPSFDIFDYVDPGLQSSLDKGVDDTLKKIGNEIKQPDTNLNSLSGRDQDLYQLTCRACCHLQNSLVFQLEQNKKLIAELQNEVRSIWECLRQPSMVEKPSISQDGAKEHSGNAEFCVAEAATVPTSAEEVSEQRLPQGEECKVTSKVSQDILLNAERQDQSKDPQCQDQSKDPECQDQSKDPECQDQSKDLDCQDQSKDSDCYNSSTEVVDANLLQSHRNRKTARAIRQRRNIRILKLKGKRKDTQRDRRRKQGDIKTYTCDVCHRQFNYKNVLIRHLRTHSGEKPYECKVCQKTFSRSSILRTHLRIHSGEKPHKCTVCQRAFSDPSCLSAHLRKHSGEKPNECYVCHKAFSQSGNLRTHLRIHSGEKPYKCTVCQKAFSVSSNLSTHLRKHSGEKPYECKVCHRAFSRSASLRTHLRIHAGEKPYECYVCHKAFSQSGNLRTHLRIHSGEKPYKCTVCQKAFSVSSNLSTHLRKHSGKKSKKVSAL
ncbi:Zinc finger protein [Pseudolycoriella hygida]|uniref:Zinc finger protein n=1 Tax=Pseudolycoriella hygida TaxID=35572 RepID=A0A9Q0NAH8_9DIPT|nr:Zinc finger protein [Pseudolycoriella hygida]